MVKKVTEAWICITFPTFSPTRGIRIVALVSEHKGKRKKKEKEDKISPLGTENWPGLILDLMLILLFQRHSFCHLSF